MAKLKIVAADGEKHYRPSPHEEVFFKITGDDTDGIFDHFDIRVAHLGGPPLHVHLEQDETFHVISGELRLKVGDQMIDATEGQFVFIPRGSVHTYVNLKEEPARAVGILTPGGFDKFVAEMAAYQASVATPDRAKIDEISARHKQRAAGPPLAVLLGLVPGAPH